MLGQQHGCKRMSRRCRRKQKKRTRRRRLLLKLHQSLLLLASTQLWIRFIVISKRRQELRFPAHHMAWRIVTFFAQEAATVCPSSTSFSRLAGAHHWLFLLAGRLTAVRRAALCCKRCTQRRQIMFAHGVSSGSESAMEPFCIRIRPESQSISAAGASNTPL